MDAKIQTILETFVLNLLASTSAEQRNVSVEKACGGDEEMRALVTALLNTTAAGGDSVPIEAPSVGDTLPFDPDAPDPTATVMRIGNYTLLEKLGAGSFGVVYLAEQVTPVQRRVALKLLKQGIESWSLLERFKMEAQALALMDHPHIAKVLDAGMTSNGRPYFVMELVQGIPVTDYCDERGLDCRKRLELMIPICKAIQHAHQKGIVHRDIKPSNALVTLRDDMPAPMVIDFGVAKAVRQGLLGPSDLTECHQIVGTPAYMSPEQVGLEGIDIDTRSDIYSLGVLLYELLTGTTPFSERESGYTRREEIFRLIREVDPPRPSARVSSKGKRTDAAGKRGTDPASLARLLRGDLDWIVMKCLEKDRSRRYETANGLALDIGRFLKCEPVLASPPSLVYRFKKFARRHLGTVIASTSVVIALAAAFLTSLMLLGSYRDRANEVLRLSDLDVIDHLNNAYPGLTRIDYRRRHGAMADWVNRAREVLSRRAAHRATLEKLRQSGTRVAANLVAPYSAAQQATPDRREQWRFADTPTQWQYDLLEKLVARLDDLQGTPDKLARVEAWLRRSPTEGEIRDRWEKAALPIQTRYDISLRHRDALVPLGSDPNSGLWEFVDLNSGLELARDGAGNLVVEPENGVLFVLIPGGRFRMGSPSDEAGRREDEAQHEVQISAFLLSKYELTQAQWERMMGQNPSRHRDPTRPVDSVSWWLAREFCRKSGYRLPTEAQWEYACRAGTSSTYGAAAPLDELGWFKENSGNVTQPVGLKRSNAFGLHDMHGNVLEWCQDLYRADYPIGSEDSRRDPVHDVPDGDLAANSRRVLRGGPFDGKPEYCRSADRWPQPADVAVPEHGLRPALPTR